MELLALGDFAVSNESAEILPLATHGVALKFPVATQAVEAHLGDGSTEFAGYGERHANEVDVLLWPEQSSCEVTRAEGAQGYPGRHGGQALAYSASSGVFVAAGGNDPLVSDAIVGALSFDVTTGGVRTLDTSDAGVLRQPRAFATATAFGPRFLIAGGEEPVFGVPEHDIEPVASAEIFDPEQARFVGDPMPLRSRRTHHAAVTLDDGRTLLVGGRSKVGDTSIAQYQLEIVDPESQRTDVGAAITPRIEPHALRLSDGRVFVGGGVGLDGALADPVAEWLTADARLDHTVLSRRVPARFERAFVATVGGGVLAVGGCEDRSASTEEATSCAASCAHGCPPLEGYDAWWIDGEGAATPVSLDGIAAPRPILLPGSDGSPWLIAAAASAPEIPRLFRFNPWAERFQPAPVPEDLELPRPGLPQPIALDPDAFVWIDEGKLVGLRLGTRNRFTRDLALVLLSDPVETRPQHLVPEGPPGTAISYDGRLELRGAAWRAGRDGHDTGPDVAVRVADTDYADLTVTLHVSGDLPLVLLGASALGGADCPWPDGPARGGDFELPSIVRRGERAVLRFHGGSQTCAVQSGRLSLALRAGDGVSLVTQLDLERGEAP